MNQLRRIIDETKANVCTLQNDQFFVYTDFGMNKNIIFIFKYLHYVLI